MQRLLITGCNGFVGKKLCECLSEKYEIIGIDKNYCDNDNILEQFNCDISEKTTFLKYNYNADCIIHLAAVTNPSLRKELIFKINSEGTKNVCEVAKKNKINKIIYLSTAAVYNSFGNSKIDEFTLEDPVNIYGESKLLAENYIKNSGVKYTILRPTNIFSKERELYKNYFKKLAKKIIFYRDRIPHFLYLYDLLEVISKTIEFECKNETFIVSDNFGEQLEKSILKNLKTNLKLKSFLLPFFTKNRDLRKFDNTKLLKKFGDNIFKFGVLKGLQNCI